MKTAVIILNWNKADLTERCLQAARSSTALPAQWIVVDNGSNPPLSRLWPGVTLLRNAQNRGFAGGANVGLKHAFSAGADYAWLLNNDAEPLPGTLEALIAAVAADAGIGLASPVILDSNTGDAIDWHGSLWRNGDYSATADSAEYGRWMLEAPDRICVVGTALLVSRALVERVGYFDESFFAYWEDTDISRRSIAEGFRNIVVADAFVRHPCEGIGTGGRPLYYYYYMARNQLLLSRKSNDSARTFYWALRRIVRWHGKPQLSKSQRKAIRRGLVDGVLGIGGPY